MEFLTNFTCLIVTTFDLMYSHIILTILIAAFLKLIQILIKNKFGSPSPKIVVAILLLIPVSIFISNQFGYLVCKSGEVEKKEVLLDEKTGYKYLITKGVFINESDIVTTAAINNSCRSVRVVKKQDGKNKVFDAKIIKILDQAKGFITFLRSNIKNKYFVAVAGENLVQDQELLIAKPKNSLTKSRVINYNPGIYATEFYSKDSRPGNSGSPIYNQKGYIVGILWGGNKEHQSNKGHMTMATSISTIRALAEENNIKLYSIKDNILNLTLNPSFYQNFGAKIFCANATTAQFGTGVFINEDTVMTNYHVVKSCNEQEILLNKQRYSSKTIAYLSDYRGDVAFLRTNTKQNSHAYVSHYSIESTPNVFFPDYVSAKPTSSRFRIGDGKTSFVGQEQSLLTIQGREISIDDMGTPIFNNKGFLVGIIQGHTINFGKQATPANSIISSALLESIPIYTYDSREYKTTPNEEQIADSVVDVYCLK